MKLKLNYLPEKYDNIILPLMTINPKLVLGGSLALHILDIMDYDFSNRKPDIDFSLLEPLTEEELLLSKDFFNLDFLLRNRDYDIDDTIGEDEHPSKRLKPKPLSYFINKDIIQLYKPNLNGKPDGVEHWDKEYIIDFFNNTYLPKKELVVIDYKDFELKLSHPSYILSHKSKYAYDSRVGKQFKHFQDLQKINWDKYFPIVKTFVPQYDFNKDNQYAKLKYYTYPVNEVINENVFFN